MQLQTKLAVILSFLLSVRRCQEPLSLIGLSFGVVSTYCFQFNKTTHKAEGFNTGCTPGVYDLTSLPQYTTINVSCAQDQIFLNATWGFQNPSSLSQSSCWFLCVNPPLNSGQQTSNCWQNWGTLMPTQSSAMLPATFSCLNFQGQANVPMNPTANITFLITPSVHPRPLLALLSYSALNMPLYPGVEVNCTIELQSLLT